MSLANAASVAIVASAITALAFGHVTLPKKKLKWTSCYQGHHIGRIRRKVLGKSFQDQLTCQWVVFLTTLLPPMDILVRPAKNVTSLFAYWAENTGILHHI
ncbi:hypothetical protein EUGRSUZ_J01474 [Eucalyptus grandis]|uniref:Uncharacterized protein n=2 Tax=Eucalyptus grandis TaxID=71139 RepID=A0ACC3J634_EUCGR|nr:hypothetical protein EUGRSUZ_J01474 [Eucalyptus grandis]